MFRDALAWAEEQGLTELAACSAVRLGSGLNSGFSNTSSSLPTSVVLPGGTGSNGKSGGSNVQSLPAGSSVVLGLFDSIVQRKR